MDFIERFLGFSPDHGDGSFEAMLFLMLLTIVTGITLRFFAQKEPRPSKSADDRGSGFY